MSHLTVTPPGGVRTATRQLEPGALTPADDRPAREGRYRRALGTGLGLSLAFHLILLLMLGRQLAIGPVTYRLVEEPAAPIEGLRVIPFRQVPDLEPAVEAEDRPEELREPPPAVGRPPAARPARAGPEADRLTNAEKLQPREGDPRLWKDFSDRYLPEGRTGFSRADSAVRAIVARMLDSLSDEQRRAAVEWLSGDGEWGVTPEGIRIGGVTIPINLGQLFSEEGPRGRAARQETRDLGEIRRQDLLEDAEAVRRERGEEMRERSREEAARREREAPPTPTDTMPPLTPD